MLGFEGLTSELCAIPTERHYAPLPDTVFLYEGILFVEHVEGTFVISPKDVDSYEDFKKNYDLDRGVTKWFSDSLNEVEVNKYRRRHWPELGGPEYDLD